MKIWMKKQQLESLLAVLKDTQVKNVDASDFIEVEFKDPDDCRQDGCTRVRYHALSKDADGKNHFLGTN